jgi:hypothetical protein
MGEWIEVASAKRGVRTGFKELSEDEELDERDREGDRLRAAGRLFSSSRAILLVVIVFFLLILLFSLSLLGRGYQEAKVVGISQRKRERV